MRRELLVPKLGLTMTEGVLVEWMVKPGEAFKAGQGLFVVESEKAANEIGAEDDGVLGETLAEVGATLPCGTVIGYWEDGQAGDCVASSPAFANGVQAPFPIGTQAAPVLVAEPGVASGNTATSPSASGSGSRIPVTPLARRLAQQKGVDLHSVTGSGPSGRIRARDVLAAEAMPQSALVPSPHCALGTTATQAAQPAACLREPSNLERTIAQRLTQAKQQIPHFYLSVEAEVSALMALRSQLNAEQSRHRLTLNHFVLAAVGQALEAMPEVNRVWTDEGILSLGASDVGMAVSTEKGLMVPVLRAIGQQTLGSIAGQSADLISRAQAGRLGGAEMQGGAITVSNAGMHDVTYMTSIINPGQAMILGVGSVREVFRPDGDGQPVIRREMGMVLSADHRVLDGVTALKFLKRVVQALSQPMGLLVA
ncbi:dihydrolipoamide acetyltransferase family protein [Cupriavidus sp. AcVe19-1a]|uniref:dihydrolipoamide acetyltransferase family protein n=1 Tax=Cupriavidus sp. AcVe19-1a TaxID=2821359 RepID=UPI001AE573EF|nr:dihydrolipoamide acetyltransferase family protein [Cupriavidus sp. AcVe19-1a]MBP0630495.1 2-oxo acid dehydrogenase subunit E2 [Cupriavidus sp. AcVe19-1a]